MSQNAPSVADNDGDLVKSLAEIKAQIVVCKHLKTTLYGVWKATPTSEKPITRAKYDEAANKLKILYTEQKALQEDIKRASRKGKKRVAPDGDSSESRRSPRKKVRSCDDTTTTERTGTRATSNSNSAMVDLDAYSPTPLEPNSQFGGQPPFLVTYGNQSQSLHNSTEPAGPLPQVPMLPIPPLANLQPGLVSLSPADRSPQAPVLQIQANLLNTEPSNAPLPSASPDLPAISDARSSEPMPDTNATWPAVAHTTPMAPTAISLPAAAGPPITDAPPCVPLIVTKASVPPLTSATPEIIVSAVVPSAIATPPSLQDATQPVTGPFPVAYQADPETLAVPPLPPIPSAAPAIIAVAPPALATPPSLQGATQPVTGPFPVAYQADPETLAVPPLPSIAPAIAVGELSVVHSSFAAVASPSHQVDIIAVTPSAIATPQDATQPVTGPVPVAYRADPETLAVLPLPPIPSAAPAITVGELPDAHSSLATAAPPSHQVAATVSQSEIIPVHAVLAVHGAEGPEKLVPPTKKAKTVTRGRHLKKDNLKIDKGITLWRDLSKEQKGKLLYEGKKAFEKWVARGKPIPFRTRLWARREASFMPELATHSKELAVMTLTTRVGNRMCHYHTRYTNHTSSDTKAAEQDLYPKVTGIPYTRSAVKARIKKESNSDDEPGDDDDGNNTDTSSGSYKPRTFAPTVYDNAMNCGCSLEDVLLDFFFWKDTMADSPTTGIREGWGGDMMDPRTRTFICALLKGQPAIELNWLYEVDDKGKMVSLSHMYLKQGRALQRWYKNREQEVNPPASDSENESLLPKTKSSKGHGPGVPSRSGDKGKQKVVASKADSQYKK